MYSQSSGIVMNQNPTPPQPQNGNSTMMRLFWITIGLIVIGGGIFLFFLMRDSKIEEEKPMSSLTLEERAEALMKLNSDFANSDGYAPLSVQERQGLLNQLNQQQDSSPSQTSSQSSSPVSTQDEEDISDTTNSSSDTSSANNDTELEERMNSLRALSELQ